MRWTVLRCAAPSLLLAALILVPFARKAFTIDDTVFLLQAQHALVDPLHPTAFVMVWADPPIPVRLSQIMATGPIMAWLLLPALLTDQSELAAHLMQLAFLALAIIATVSLALRLGLTATWAALAGLLVTATPTALAMAGTAMPDVSAMALGVAGLERLVAWRDSGGVHRAVVGSALLALGVLARSHLILLVGIGALLLAGDYLTDARWRSRPWRTWLPLAAAPLLTLAVLFVTRDPQGSTAELAGASKLFSKLSHVPPNAVSFAVHWVLAVPLALPWLLMRPRALVGRWWVFLLATGVAGVTLWIRQDPRALVVAPIAGLGATVLLDVLADAWRRRDSLQLTLGLWLLVALPVAIYVHLPSKYLLASVPAMGLLLAREAARRAAASTRPILALTVLLGVALGVGILRADAAFADLGRRAAAELIAPNVAAGHRVWFAANWGFQWYALRAGGSPVTLAPPYPEPGDLLVTAEKTDAAPRIKHLLSQRYGQRVRHLARLEDRRSGGRHMDTALGVGFYSNAWGHLPWIWSDNLLDAFDLWRVE